MINMRRYQLEALAALGMLSGPNILEMPRTIPKKIIYEPRYKPEIKKYSKSRDDKKFKLKGIRP